MVVDICYFNGEDEVLEARLNILAPYVDLFIVCEAEETFSGMKKTLTFNKEKHKDFPIRYFIMHETPELRALAMQSPNIGAGEHYWVREFIQKESARFALTFLDDTDMVFISDVDEVWNPALDYAQDRIYKPKQLPYLYYFNQRTDEDWLGWTGTVACRYEHIKNGIINHLRTDGMTEYTVLENGGWHFNAIGGKQRKVDAFKHPVYDDGNVWRTREVDMRKDESDLPDWVLNKKQQWTHLFL